MKKILILGGRSFLASQFKKYLNKNNEKFISVDETVSNNYSLSFLDNILKKEKPSVILDFKFPLVSSNDKDYKHIDEDSFFRAQKNLLLALENTRLNLDKLILISSRLKMVKIFTLLLKGNKKCYTKLFLTTMI